MNVLSLFDGMACGLVALKRAGINVDNYYASEIDKWAIKIAKKNHPEIKCLGSVEDYGSWGLPKIDLIIGGSPCQGFSFAGKQLNFNDPRSALFFKFVEIIWKYEPQYFLMENVKMKKEYSQAISELLEVENIEINSALVSAQNRKRLYWCNWRVDRPNDEGILLKDILECGSNTLSQRPRGNNNGGMRENKSPSMSSSSWVDNVHVVRAGRIVGRNPENPKSRTVGLETEQMIEINQNPEKTNCLSTAQKDNVIVFDKCIQVGLKDGNGSHEIQRRIYSPNGKSPTLLAINSGGAMPPLSGLDKDNYRKLTPVECERLQTLPDNYTDGVSNNQRYKMIGNGWTVDVIAHILKSIGKEKDEQLSF